MKKPFFLIRVRQGILTFHFSYAKRSFGILLGFGFLGFRVRRVLGVFRVLRI